MQISEQFKDQYQSYLMSYLPEELIRNSEFKASILKGLEDLIELSEIEVCEARKNGLGLSCEARDLAERTIKLESGSEIIAGARFKNLNVEFPFVEVQVCSPISKELVREISVAVRTEFKSLRPLGFKFKDRPNAHPSFEKWSHTVFGRITEQAPTNLPSGLSLTFSSSLEWHEQYIAEYQARLAEKKELDGFVRIGQLDEFKESVDSHALLLASDIDGFCGVIAGIQSPIYGLPAIYMIESYLSKRWVGRKIAPITHAFFLNEIAKRYDYVWGTIYDRNLSSLNTALRVGRRIIETEYFVIL